MILTCQSYKKEPIIITKDYEVLCETYVTLLGSKKKGTNAELHRGRTELRRGFLLQKTLNVKLINCF